jgi:hypothetical protein
VPPAQCPHCGRFLKQALVEALVDEPAPCPRCEAPLRAEDFVAPAAGTAEAAEPAVEAAEPAEPAAELAAVGAAGRSTAATSVRPPDLEPGEVRDDVLAGWDTGVNAMVAVGRRDEPPFPTDTVVVAAAAATGAIAGALIDRRRVRGAVLGGLGAATLAAVVRRVWRLEA